MTIILDTIAILQIIFQTCILFIIINLRGIFKTKFTNYMLFAVSLMLLRRLTAFLLVSEILSERYIAVIRMVDRLALPLMISVFLFISVYCLYKDIKEMHSHTHLKVRDQ